VQPRQLPLFAEAPTRPFNYPFPTTRYQGSKRTLVDWIWNAVGNLSFDSVLDAFGGTGVVSHMFKNAGKRVVYNDILRFNWNFALALIENRSVKLCDEDVELVLSHTPSAQVSDFIQSTFRDIYFTHEENAWLDRTVYNIDHLLSDPYRQALARFALCQACIIKRPYNLFHRANLYMREARVERSFGNKVTWDTSFETHFRNFVREANAAVFDNQKPNSALIGDALDTPTDFDLVYIDPPYLNERGIGVDYHDFYHFLEGLVDYDTWRDRVDFRSKHRRLLPARSPWNNAKTVLEQFRLLLDRHRHSIIVISYRSNGIPSRDQLLDVIRGFKHRIHEASLPKQYVLSRQKSHELLLIGS
jgi:adenine-specific DNA methylase